MVHGKRDDGEQGELRQEVEESRHEDQSRVSSDPDRIAHYTEGVLLGFRIVQRHEPVVVAHVESRAGELGFRTCAAVGRFGEGDTKCFHGMGRR